MVTVSTRLQLQGPYRLFLNCVQNKSIWNYVNTDSQETYTCGLLLSGMDRPVVLQALRSSLALNGSGLGGNLLFLCLNDSVTECFGNIFESSLLGIPV